jgi:hypothetical protein
MLKNIVMHIVRQFNLTLPIILGITIYCFIPSAQLFSPNTSFAWTGPCITGGTCGGLGGKEGQFCECGGSCPAGCAAGGTNSFCVGDRNECQPNYSNCSRVITYSCIKTMGGACKCIESGTGGWCGKENCS